MNYISYWILTSNSSNRGSSFRVVVQDICCVRNHPLLTI